MSLDDTDPVGVDIEGLQVDDAVERVSSGKYDPETVRTVLNAVAEDGVVTWDGVDDALGDAATIVSTPETRIEHAERDLDRVREAASHVDDLTTVASRLDEFESRLEAVTEQCEGLTSKLDSVVDRVDARTNLFAVAADIRRLESAANGIQGTADELRADIEEFEQWVDSADARYRELGGDLDAVAEALDDLERTVDVLSNAMKREAPSSALPEGVDDPGALWFSTVLDHRTYRFMIGDIRAELAEFREWAERENRDEREQTDGVLARLDELEARADAIGDGIDDLATGRWVERFAGHITTFDRELDALDRPADWREVERILDEQRSALE